MTLPYLPFIEDPLAFHQLRQSKVFLPYQQHNASVAHSLNSSVAKKSVLNVDKITLCIPRTAARLLSACQVFDPRPILVIEALVFSVTINIICSEF
jgi:hypothetical protein